MFQGKSIIQFGVLVVVLSTLLLYPWAPIQRSYLSAFRAGNNALFSRFWFWPEGSVHFLDLTSKTLRSDVQEVSGGKLPARVQIAGPTGQQDTLLVIRKRQVGTFGMLRFIGRSVGYWPTAWLIILILAKPLPWRRRCWAMLWGLLLVHVFLAMRITMYLADKAFGAPSKAYALFHPSPFWADMFSRLDQILMQDPTISFAVPTFIWFLVAFTRKDWSAFGQVVRGGMKQAADED